MATSNFFPASLPIQGNGLHRIFLCYYGWRAGLIVPVFADDGSLPFFLSKPHAEEAARVHQLPWQRLILQGCSTESFAAFCANQPPGIVVEYHGGLTFDLAWVEAREGKMRVGAREVMI